MNRLLLRAVVVATLVLGSPVEAGDARLVSRLYQPDEVVRIEGRPGVQAAIAFGDDEAIENVAIGDSGSWQVTPNKRATLLFIKPLAATARTNMTVVTNKHSYYFDLVAAKGAQPLYALRFTYLEAPAMAAGDGRDTAGANEEERLAASDDAAEPPVDLASLNFAWTSKGKRKLLPTRIYDNGRSTYLTWATGQAIPAVLVRDSRGAEGPVNFAVHDDVLVIEGVPPLLVLRSGRDTATLENRGARRRTATNAPVAVGPLSATLAAGPGQGEPTPEQKD